VLGTPDLYLVVSCESCARFVDAKVSVPEKREERRKKEKKRGRKRKKKKKKKKTHVTNCTRLLLCWQHAFFLELKCDEIIHCLQTYRDGGGGGGGGGGRGGAYGYVCSPMKLAFILLS